MPLQAGITGEDILLNFRAMDDVTSLIDGLNPAQRDAVAADDRHLLVLAGAGSGKTRVLVHRIAWQIATEQASPFGILAVTFTNKAAAEMRGRIEQLLDMSADGMWVGTFHGLAHRLLKMHWSPAAAGPLAGGRAPPGLPDHRCGRPDSPDQAGEQGTGAG